MGYPSIEQIYKEGSRGARLDKEFSTEESRNQKHLFLATNKSISEFKAAQGESHEFWAGVSAFCLIAGVAGTALLPQYGTMVFETFSAGATSIAPKLDEAAVSALQSRSQLFEGENFGQRKEWEFHEDNAKQATQETLKLYDTTSEMMRSHSRIMEAAIKKQ